MGTTPIYHFPYPEPPDAADGPDAVENLARAIEMETARVWQIARNSQYANLGRPTLQMRRVGALSVPHNTWTTIPFDTTDVNTIGAAPDAWYLASWGAAFVTGPTVGFPQSLLAINGVCHPSGLMIPRALPVGTYGYNVIGRLLLVNLGPTKSVSVQVLQSSGAALALDTAVANQAFLMLMHVAGPLPATYPPS